MNAVAIPMANEVDSLNVGAAAAVFLYEANRQRKKLNAKTQRRRDARENHFKQSCVSASLR